MDVIKPSWVKHQDDKNRRQCIFTCDIDRSGQRLATGGMDSVIRIWRVSGLFESLEMQEESKLLASMSRHNGSVLCVRWSCNGLLASSSDDTIILIWQLDSRPASLRGNLEGLNDVGEVVENYKIVKRLIGHQSDTVGVEWSPDGRVLASCSLDGTICFWNVDPSSSQALIGKIERAHSGFIKGLAWDPAGKYLASQSDDGSCIVWNVESMLASQSSSTAFTLDTVGEADMFKESVLDKIFVNMSKMTFFHRPDWSPDGSLLALANATNRQLPAVALIERNNWHGLGTFFVGHLGPVEAVRFNPRLFTDRSGELGRKELICAVASQDGQVSIWSSSRTSPLIVLEELFEHSVMDLAWTRDGTVLVAVSYDGTAVATRINPCDFNLCLLSDLEQAEHLKNAFGNRSSMSDSAQGGYVENVKVIDCLRENEQFLSNHPITKDTPSDDPPSVPRCDEPRPISPAAVTNEPVTTIINGKKRITPQLLMTNNQSSGSSQLSMSQLTTARTAGSGMRLRDEDFLIHRKLLERASGPLLGRLKSDSNSPVFEVSSEAPESLSLPLTSLNIFSVSIEISNYDLIGGRKPSSLIQFIQNSQIIWKDRIKGTILLASVNRNFSAFIVQRESFKYSLLVLTASGRRYFPPIALDSRPVYLSLNNGHILSVITQNGTVSIWNLKASKSIFSDSSLNSAIPEIPVKLLTFDENSLKISLVSTNDANPRSIVYNKELGSWIIEGSGLKQSSAISSPESSSQLLLQSERIEKLKSALLSNEIGNDRQISELEFEISLIFINLRNGKKLNSSECAHFERTLAIYSLKLAKESSILKARELIDDLKEFGFEDLIDGLLKPFFSYCQNSSLWQDFLSESF